MPDSITSLLIGGIGGAIATVFQYAFRRYAETQQVRREVVETRLLQLQNSVESLYYRANNLLDWGGRAEMSDEYFLQTSIFVFASILGHEALLVSTGIYAKLRSDNELKSDVKGALHRLNSAMDRGGLLHYYRVQLADMACAEDRVLTFTEFLDRWKDSRFERALNAAKIAVASLQASQLEPIREEAERLVTRLSRKTGVPTALSLTGGTTSRAPA